MRLVYLGSPTMAVAPLEALHGAGHEIALVVTNPPRRRSRRSGETPTPVAQRAADLGIPIAHDPEAVLSVDADLGVVVAYGHIIRPHVLTRLRMLNLHFSLLPRWRGAAPVERAILAGDERTGVCVMDVEEGLDTGGIHACREVAIGPDTTAAQLRDELVDVGASLLVDTLEKPLGSAVPQADDGVTYADKIRNEDLYLDWGRTAVELSRVVRVGGAWTTLSGKRLKVLEAEPVADPPSGRDAGAAARSGGYKPLPGTLSGDRVTCGSGTLRLVTVQPEGRRAMAAEAFLNGARLGPGTRLGT